MSDEAEGQPTTWTVSPSPTTEGVVHVHIGNGVTIILPALEAHKLGMALQVACGIDGTDAILDALMDLEGVARDGGCYDSIADELTAVTNVVMGRSDG